MLGLKNDSAYTDRTWLPSIKGVRFSFCGKLATGYMEVWDSRDELEKYLEKYGAIVERTLSDKTDYLVNLQDEEFSVVKKANELRVKVISEPDFNRLVGKRYKTGNTASFPPWLKTVPQKAFAQDTNLKTITIPDGIERIERGAFLNCKSIEEIFLPGSVSVIEPYAFSCCSSLKRVVSPRTLKEIGEKAFYDCGNLSEISFAEDVIVDENAFEYCDALAVDGLIIINGTLVNCIKKTPTMIIPQGVKRIGNDAFHKLVFSRQKYVDPTREIIFPDTLTSIGSGAFIGCNQIRYLTFPEGLTSIDNNVFLGCSNFRKVWIPESTTELAELALEGCNKITVYTPPGSYAESYAVRKGIKCKPCSKEAFESIIEKEKRKQKAT